MRHIAAIALALWALPGAAQEDAADSGSVWQGFADDAALRDFLIAHDLDYETGASQRFLATGRTLYHYVETSWGYWRVEGGRYCSQWPPGDTWDCYEVTHDGAGSVRFVDDWGNVSVGAFAE